MGGHQSDVQQFHHYQQTKQSPLILLTENTKKTRHIQNETWILLNLSFLFWYITTHDTKEQHDIILNILCNEMKNNKRN